MSLQKGYFQKCPKCNKKGVYIDPDTGRPRCKYCGMSFANWKEIKILQRHIKV